MEPLDSSGPTNVVFLEGVWFHTDLFKCFELLFFNNELTHTSSRILEIGRFLRRSPSPIPKDKKKTV